MYTKPKGKSDQTTGSPDEVKCELRDNNGQLITITGNANDPQFQQMCKSQANQQFYIQGYPYYFVRYWTPYTYWGGWGHGRRR